MCASGSAQDKNRILFRNTTVELKGSKLKKVDEFLIQIDDKHSDWISDISIPYQEGNKPKITEAAVVDLDGNILRKLKKKEITFSNRISRISLYEDQYQMTFSLKWHQYPYRIRYSYEESVAEFLFLTYWYPAYHEVPVDSATLSVQVPSEYPFKARVKGDFEYLVDTLKNQFNHHWTLSEYTPKSPGKFAPPKVELSPHVYLIPDSFDYGIPGSTESWSSFGNWQAQLNAGRMDLPEVERKRIDQLLSGIKDTREKIRKLYQYMQENTRYINVSIDIGGLQPYPASYVSENRYGDCKALTNYMKSLLNYAGIRSHYTKIFAGENPVRFDPEYPGHQSNHVILCVPLDSDTVWLENTNSFYPAGYLGTFTQDRWALLVDGDQSRLVRTPSLNSEDVLVFTRINIGVHEDGSSNISMFRTMRGKEYETYHYCLKKTDQKHQKEKIESDLPFDRFQDLKWQLEVPNDTLPEIHNHVSLKNPAAYRILGNSIVISSPELPVPPYQITPDRKAPIRINYPVNRVDSIVYEVPLMSSYSLQLPDNVTIESEFGKYLESYESTGNMIYVCRSFLLNSGEYPPEKDGELNEFIEAIITSNRQNQIILKRKS